MPSGTVWPHGQHDAAAQAPLQAPLQAPQAWALYGGAGAAAPCRSHEVPIWHTPGKKYPRALGVWPAHENGHIMSVGTRGNYIWALGAHR